MDRNLKLVTGITIILSLTLLLSACSGATNMNEVKDESDNASNKVLTESDPITTRTFNDYLENEVEIPVSPERVVILSSTPGDLLTLGVYPVGASLTVIESQVVYPELLEDIEDLGSGEFNFEKMVTLDPDLILIDGIVYADSYSRLSKIAPTVAFDSNMSMYDRLRLLADLTGKEKEAEDWIATYEAKAEDVMGELDQNEGVTASVMLVIGEDLFVMGNRGIAVTLFDVLGYKPALKVQELIEANERFVKVSEEVLPDYAGDWIFVLAEEQEKTVVTDSSVWQSIPAVEEGNVIFLDRKWNFDDPITRERLLSELVDLMGK
ncbi:ABC transporter substrate-binding protein [Salipaludibacillus sp. HK11]|uniref:ABC transporter substrate-binding protein n=1 Tax=Salipaludibacillus sp. HK11 TaxID=3394320 RepID=UPI0039FCE085